MSQIVLHESTEWDQTSSDEELREIQYFKNFEKQVKMMLRRRTPIDKRLINFYHTRKAKQNDSHEKQDVEEEKVVKGIDDNMNSF